MDFSAKRVSEKVVLSVDFADSKDLAVGETIVSAAWSNSVHAGNDPFPNAMISGAPTLAGTKILQLVIDGIAGTRYYPICTAQTSGGQVLILPLPGEGLLLVVADAG
jgi:hypothetical protein